VLLAQPLRDVFWQYDIPRMMEDMPRGHVVRWLVHPIVPRSATMRPTIDQTTFGSITIAGQLFAHDVLIRPDGQVTKRKKKLSKAVYGTSHILSLAEAKQVYATGSERLIIGSGQEGNVRLSEEAEAYFKHKHCRVRVQPTPKAIQTWNTAEGAVIGLFHVTC
jgi:hypothetical protein